MAIKSTNVWRWSCILPGQRDGFSTRQEMMASMAKVIHQIRDGKALFKDVDIEGVKIEKSMPGGMVHVLSFLPKSKKSKKGAKR